MCKHAPPTTTKEAFLSPATQSNRSFTPPLWSSLNTHPTPAPSQTHNMAVNGWIMSKQFSCHATAAKALSASCRARLYVAESLEALPVCSVATKFNEMPLVLLQKRREKCHDLTSSRVAEDFLNHPPSSNRRLTNGNAIIR